MNLEKQSEVAETTKKSSKKHTIIVAGIIIVLLVSGIGIFQFKKYKAYEPYKKIVSDYNTVAEGYNNLVGISSIEFVKDLPESVDLKEVLEKLNNEEIQNEVEKIETELEKLVAEYQVVKAITNPSEEAVQDILSKIPSIMEFKGVTENNDPNQLLGKEGGYTSCTYFTVKGVSSAYIKDEKVIEQGTDAGGCIEVYENKESALNRCDYLSQFDGTILYSGSYAIIGTMVVRTSYLLTDEQQVELTNEITKQFTTIV